MSITTHQGVAVFSRAGMLAAHGYHGLYAGGRIYIDAELTGEARERVIRHEACHARQHRASGLSFTAWLAEYRRIERTVGYLNHPWEIEARRAENPTNLIGV